MGTMQKILLIEDQAPMRESLMLMLQMEGFEVLVAEEGNRGIELARGQTPDLILCDVMMPGCDGYQVLQTLRENPATATIPFIFLTAKGEKTDLRAGMNLGADDYLVKPAPREELLAAIQARLQKKQQHELHAQTQLNNVKFSPDFSSPLPLESLGLSPREAEVLFWIAQGKNNEEIGLILTVSRNTIKKHVIHLLDKLGVDTRNAAAMVAIEHLPKVRSKN
jgi:DNA-binding NarL/FixJ family response regulator